MRNGRAKERGAVSVAVVVVMVVLGVMVGAVVLGGGRDQSVAVLRTETVRAFYAAESGVQMAMRELVTGVDHDGDGVIGGVSGDGDSSNDPAVGPARVSVRLEVSGGVETLVSEGVCGGARRRIEVRIER